MPTPDELNLNKIDRLQADLDRALKLAVPKYAATPAPAMDRRAMILGDSERIPTEAEIDAWTPAELDAYLRANGYDPEDLRKTAGIIQARFAARWAAKRERHESNDELRGITAEDRRRERNAREDERDQMGPHA